MDGLRITASGWSKTLETLVPGQELALHYFRGDELLQTRLTPVAPPADTWVLTLAEVEGDKLERRRKWLGQ